MEELFAFLNKLGGASFATLLVIILWGSWKRIWVWGRETAEIEARLRQELAHAEEREQWWRDIAVRATGIAETQGRVLRVKETKEQEIEKLNKRLLRPSND